ncbi:MAG: hypothetical protein DMF62_06725 [Acidobacteria bacterium]|nr:MAG: hypothetical protein DMF62_06725 [Acidobacteriota bacterium]
MPRENNRIEFRVDCVLESSSGRHEVVIRDIGSGGCYIDSIISVSIGEVIKFELVHPNGGRLPFTGIVAYHFNGLGFGVRFTDLTNEQDLFLQRILRI